MTRYIPRPEDLRQDLHQDRPMRRRQVLGMLGATGALLVVGCGDDGDSSTGSSDAGSTGSPTTGGPTTGGTTTGSSGASTIEPTTGEGMTGTTGTAGTTGTTSTTDPTATTGAIECGDPAAAWATGGTASMTAQDCYPNPFARPVLSCALICETTAGPCTTAVKLERKDVSEGFAGLPVRLSLLVVDADTCAPVSGARVEIWHTQRTGVYSGVTPNPPACYLDDPEAATFMYFRGTQIAGADGRVDFDTCFPGWYSGRAIHIHFQVIRDDQVYATSQLFFADELNAEIFASHPDYSEFGQPDRTNISDNIIGNQADKSNYVLDTARMPDGAMLASKVIAIRSSLQDASCDV